MLTIDGSRGEGGGQIVRSAVALSAITGEPVTITGIRAARRNKGLAAQHIAAIRAVAGTCDAECSGLSPGSSTLTFFPRAIKSRDFSIDIGTAGSIPLVIQAWLPVALHTGGSLHVTGGTGVASSPTIDYLDQVFCRILRDSGAKIPLEIIRRGYYPKGGGEVIVRVEKTTVSPIIPLTKEEDPVTIISCSSNLPDHIAPRQASAAQEYLTTEKIEEAVQVLDQRPGPGTGTSCTVWKGAKGGSALGKPGLPAERVGRMAAESFVAEYRKPGTVDTHLSDQLLVPLAIFGGHYTTSSLTPHAETLCRLLAQFGYTVQHHTGTTVEFSA
jgi:RNA 3'-terminal phosphate cyclase (ATP)